VADSQTNGNGDRAGCHEQIDPCRSVDKLRKDRVAGASSSEQHWRVDKTAAANMKFLCEYPQGQGRRDTPCEASMIELGMSRLVMARPPPIFGPIPSESSSCPPNILRMTSRPATRALSTSIIPRGPACLCRCAGSTDTREAAIGRSL